MPSLDDEMSVRINKDQTAANHASLPPSFSSLFFTSISKRHIAMKMDFSYRECVPNIPWQAEAHQEAVMN
jgi:Sec7-like guanine-nucleotide exchange factor